MPDFNCTNLELVRVQMNSIWNDAAFKREIQPEVAIVKALLEMQTADVRFFDAGDKKKKAKVYWVEACDGAVVDCDDSCTPDGAEIGSNCLDYDIQECKQSTFKIDDSVFYDNYIGFNEAVAKGLLKHTTLLDNQIEKFVIAKLDSFAGVNKYTADDKGDVVGNTTYIKGSYWNPSLMSYFAKVGSVNYIDSSMMISGENMFDAWYRAGKNSDNANGAGDKNMFDSFNWFFDIKNFDATLGTKKTLMVSPNAAAFVSTHKFLTPDEVSNGANITRFSIPSQNLPGVTYDVVYRTECKDGGDHIIHYWTIKSRFDVFQSPVTCESECTGILSFTCGEAPAP